MTREFDRLSTEQRNPRTTDIDRLPLEEIVRRIQEEDATVPAAVAAVRADVVRAAELVCDRMRRGGRMILVGAGTSGRLGVLEAAECPPTFDTPPDRVVAIMAGGPECVWAGREGAEDDAEDGARQIRARGVGSTDAVIGIAASGATPFVQGALAEARNAGAGRILVTCNREGLDPRCADVIVASIVGPETITGSTRLKAGTATKLILNAITVATMVRLGKVYENLMVDLQPKSEKLAARAKRIIRTLAGVDDAEADRALTAAGNRAKTAVVMLRRRVSREEAEALLARAGGMLRGALEG